MSALAIVVLAVVVVVLLVALLVFVPRMRERRRLRMSERELRRRREGVIAEQYEEAASRNRLADRAEQRARIAQQQARRERADAQLSQERASLHERGMADHELVGDEERERFAGTSAAGLEQAATGADADRVPDADAGRGADPAVTGSRTGAYPRRGRSAHDSGADDLM